MSKYNCINAETLIKNSKGQAIDMLAYNKSVIRNMTDNDWIDLDLYKSDQAENIRYLRLPSFEVTLEISKDTFDEIMEKHPDGEIQGRDIDIVSILVSNVNLICQSSIDLRYQYNNKLLRMLSPIVGFDILKEIKKIRSIKTKEDKDIIKDIDLYGLSQFSDTFDELEDE